MAGWFLHFAEEYKRARHTYGFGVHSPYAYNLVRLLRMRRDVGFYADGEISEAALSESGSRLRATALRFHRLCSAFTEGRVYVSPSAPAAIGLAATLASSRLKMIDNVSENQKFDVGYFRMKDIPLPALEGILSSGCPLAMVEGLSETEACATARKAGTSLLLTGPRMAIFVRRQGMRPVSYTVRI